MEFDLIQWVRLGQSSFTLEAPTYKLARKILYSKAATLAQWAIKFGYDAININFPEAERPFRVPISLLLGYDKESFDMIIPVPGLYIGEIKVYGSNFLRMLLELIDRKDENAGIARLRDNKQIVLTAGSATAMGVEDATPLTNLRREDYWNLGDLAEFNREWRQNLREDGSNSIEFTYRALDNPLDRNSGWVRQTTRYNLFADGAELYHRASTLDVVVLR